MAKQYTSPPSFIIRV